MESLSWAVIGAIIAVSSEVLMRLHKDMFPWPALIMNWGVTLCVWQILRHDNIISGMITWSLTVAMCRTAASLLIGDYISAGSWVGLALLVLAAFVKKL